MKGRQTIVINRSMTMQELLQFMEDHWDRAQQSEFGVTKKSNGELEYVVLPATEHWDVIVYTKAAGGLFNKDNKIVLSAARSLHAVDPDKIDYFRFYNRNSVSNQIKRSKEAIDLNAEMQGPCEDALQEYTGYLTSLLVAEGLH